MRTLIRALLSSPAALAAVVVIMVAYLLLYLWLTGDLSGGGSGGWQAVFPAWDRVWQRRGPFQFEPVGLFALGGLVWTFSPLNTLIAASMGLLVGLNAVAGWWLWRIPRQCRSGAGSTGLLGSLPALLAGGACCAPLMLIWLGLPIAGTVASLAPVLLPGAALMLSVGLWRISRRLAPSSASECRGLACNPTQGRRR